METQEDTKRGSLEEECEEMHLEKQNGGVVWKWTLWGTHNFWSEVFRARGGPFEGTAGCGGTHAGAGTPLRGLKPMEKPKLRFLSPQ